MNLRPTIACLVTLLTMAAGCDQAIEQTPCGEVPVANGCPDNADHTICAADHTCTAAYSCVGGAWTLDHVCPAYDAGSGSVGDATVDSASPEASVCSDVAFDVPPGSQGGPGCIDLQGSDCPLSTVLVCSPNATDPCNGCDSLFYCQAGEWIPWGECTAEAGVVASY